MIKSCALCLYAGSLVPQAVVAEAPDNARILDTAAMTLDDIIAEIEIAHKAGRDIARVHSGDPSLYGAAAEQIRRVVLNIPYDITPGVSACAAAAAALGIELTIPEISQTLILTRNGNEIIGNARRRGFDKPWSDRSNIGDPSFRFAICARSNVN